MQVGGVHQGKDALQFPMAIEGVYNVQIILPLFVSFFDLAWFGRVVKFTIYIFLQMLFIDGGIHIIFLPEWNIFP